MRIHITGMSPRMVSQRTRERVTFARALEQALTRDGYEVHRGPEDPGEAADLVLGGVTSALSPGATYALVGLETIGRAVEEERPLLLYVDDPVMGAVRAAAQSALREVGRIYSPYLMSKRVKQSRQLGERQQEHIHTAVEMLAGEKWPPVLVPLHPWGSSTMAAKRLGIVSDVIPIDVSDVIELPPVVAPDVHAPIWLTDTHYSRWQLEPERVRWPVIPIDSAAMPDPAKVYSVARGVHQGPVDRMPGWWTPTPLYARHAGTVYLGDAEETRTIGTDTPYYLTSDDVEGLSDSQHLDLVHDQAEYLQEVTWSSAMLSSSLTDWIGRVRS